MVDTIYVHNSIIEKSVLTENFVLNFSDLLKHNNMSVGMLFVIGIKEITHFVWWSLKTKRRWL